MAAGGTFVEWAVAARTFPGQAESGDLHLVQESDRGALIAVMDGLGHGAEAAKAARRGCEALMAHAGAPVATLFEACHAATASTRGMAMSLALVDGMAGTITWAAIGNVDGLLVRARTMGSAGDSRSTPGGAPARREHVLMRGGVVGYRMPPVRTSTLALAAGDLLVLCTDGLDAGFGATIRPGASPREIADELLARHARDTDDALVLVARYLGA